MEIQVARDFERWPEFMAMETALGAEQASHVFIRFWVELGYEAESTQRSGFVPAHSWPRYEARLSREGAEAIRTAHLVEEVEDGLMCRRFSETNRRLNGGLTMQQKGNMVSLHTRKMKKAEASAAQDLFAIPPETWTTPEGTPMSPDETKRSLLLIRGCDLALGLPERPETAAGFPATLVHDAHRLITAYPQEKLKEALKTLRVFREHPLVPRSTDRLLAAFPETMSELEKINS